MSTRFPLRATALLALTACAALATVTVAHAASPTPPAGATLEGDNKRFEGVVGARTGDSPAAKLFEDSCAACHVRGAAPHAPHRDMLQLLSPESIVAALDTGSMKQQAAALSQEQRVAVAEFIAGRPVGSATDTPVAPVCTGRSARFDFRDTPPWQGWGFGNQNHHYVPSATSGITAANVGRLKLKWAFALPGANRVRSQPMPAGGALYVGSHSGEVFALDRESGCVRWRFQAGSEVRTGIVISGWKAGDRRARPTLYFGDFLGSVYAVDAIKGSLLWRVRPDQHPSATITAAPVLQDGKLLVSVSSLEVLSAVDPKFACCTFRGSVRALDPATGAEIWKTYTVREPAAPAGTNKIGTPILAPSGAPVWSSVAVDAARRMVYFGTGENYSSMSTDTSDAVFGISLDTGEIRWVYQATKGDAFNGGCLVADRTNCPVEDGPDVDFGSAVIFNPDIRAGGVVLAGQKNGILHALDPATGQLAWKTRVGRGGVVGGIHFGMAASATTVYVPVTDTPDGKTYPDPPRPGVFAINAATGTEVWAAPMADRCGGRALCYPGVSQAISATTDLVFAGGIDGWLRIHDSTDGKVLWEADTNASVKTVSGAVTHGGSMGGGAAPVPYRGRLYVSSGYAFAGYSGGNVLLAYEVAKR
jgi:polyvinyl alcohol dehydrogenase (cytochrome)